MHICGVHVNVRKCGHTYVLVCPSNYNTVYTGHNGTQIRNTPVHVVLKNMHTFPNVHVYTQKNTHIATVYH